MLNIKTFKKFCLKTGTTKADEVHDYFIKLETIVFEITKEECEEIMDDIYGPTPPECLDENNNLISYDDKTKLCQLSHPD